MRLNVRDIGGREARHRQSAARARAAAGAGMGYWKMRPCPAPAPNALRCPAAARSRQPARPSTAGSKLRWKPRSCAFAPAVDRVLTTVPRDVTSKDNSRRRARADFRLPSATTRTRDCPGDSISRTHSSRPAPRHHKSRRRAIQDGTGGSTAIAPGACREPGAPPGGARGGSGHKTRHSPCRILA